MARQRGFRPRGRPISGRQTAWGFGPGDTAVTTFTATSKSIMGTGLGLTAGTGKATIARLHGEFSAYLTSASSANNGYSCAFGVGLVTLVAFGAGVASIPGPLTQLDWDGWMFHKLFSCVTVAAMSGAASGDADNQLSTVAAIRFDVDSKAMRKMDEEVILVGVLEVVELGTAALSALFDSRLLLKLG